MDIYNMYIGDNISHLSMRGSTFRDYERNPYGSYCDEYINRNTKDYYNSVQEKKKKVQEMKNKEKSSKDSCPFCKEQKKRPLGVYLRKRLLSKGSDKISEEDEYNEINEENVDEQSKEHEHTAHHSHAHKEKTQK